MQLYFILFHLFSCFFHVLRPVCSEVLGAARLLRAAVFAVKCLLRLFYNRRLQVKLQLAASQRGDELQGRGLCMCLCAREPTRPRGCGLMRAKS